MERRALSSVANYDNSRTQAWRWIVKSDIMDLTLRCSGSFKKGLLALQKNYLYNSHANNFGG